MPKSSQHMSRKSAPHVKGRKSRRKHPADRHPLALAAKRAPSTGRISAVPSVRPASIPSPVAPRPYLLGELKMSGIIGGALLLLLIVLSLVL